MPTQSLYHVPTEVWSTVVAARAAGHVHGLRCASAAPAQVLMPTGNLVVLVEESSDIQARDVAQVALVLLHGHPNHD